MEPKRQNKRINLIKQKQSHRYTEETGGCQERSVWEEEKSICEGD